MPALGVTGSALGTVIAQLAGVVALVLVLRGGSLPNLHLPLQLRPIDRPLARELFRIGWPAALDMLVLNAGFLAVLVPLWDAVEPGGNNTRFRIIGLAAFVLTAHTQPAVDSITGRFLGFYQLPTIGANATWGDPPCDVSSSSCTSRDQTVFVGLIE